MKSVIHARATLQAAGLVPAAHRTRAVARLLGLSMVIFALLTLLAPWQQSVTGEGRVVAYAPNERRQPLDAPVAGRLVRWHVREGSAVAEGDPIVEISDNDPLLIERLDAERSALESKLASYEARLGSLDAQIAAATAARRSELASAEAKVRASAEKLKAQEQKLKAAEAALETAMLNLGRVKALHDRGLAAQRERELADLAATKTRTERDGAQADVLSAVGDLDAARASLDKARAEGDAKIQDADAKLRSGQSDVADARASLARLQVSIARQQNQLVRAPRAGVVLQVLAVQGGKQVKQGETLAILVPDTSDRAVELWVDGNDAAIVSEGRKVRLQFEGWPAVQFTGWPSVAVGSFGGVVSFIDAHDDGKGNFRVFVKPDLDDEPWPSPRFLRQGVRAKGWVLLERVSLGFELWRRFNGFPPMLGDPPGGSDGETKGGKS